MGQEKKDIFLISCLLSSYLIISFCSLRVGMFQNGVNYDLAVEHHSRMRRARDLLAKKNLNKVKKGGVILARRKWRPESQWGRGNIKQTWFPAEIIKVRTNSDKSESYDVSR